jgi:transcriptional regulator with XRE-family HTH domain
VHYVSTWVYTCQPPCYKVHAGGKKLARGDCCACTVVDMQAPTTGRAIGLHIGQWRERLRMTGRGLADKTKEIDPESEGVSHSYIAKLEGGRVESPGMAKLEWIARALGFDDLVEMLRSDPRGPMPTNLRYPVTTPLGDGLQAINSPVELWAEMAALKDRQRVLEENQKDFEHLFTPREPSNVRGVRTQDHDGDEEIGDLSIYSPAAAALKLADASANVEEIGTAKPPAKHAAKIGHNGFAMEVEGMSMAGYVRDDGTPDYILPGHLAWIDPENIKRPPGLVIALVKPMDGDDPVAVIKYHDGAGHLFSQPKPEKREPLPVRAILAMTPVIVVTSEREQ